MRLFNNWINGDCLKELKKMEAESVDLVITSPPYHNLRVYSNDPSFKILKKEILSMDFQWKWD